MLNGCLQCCKLIPSPNGLDLVKKSFNIGPECCTIHWKPLMTQLWMNLNLVEVWFHLGSHVQERIDSVSRKVE
jgi:hypothetical protein